MEQIYDCYSGGVGGRMDWEFGIGMYTLIYLK